MNSNTIDTRIIKVKIHEESDLYAEMDPDHKMLSDDTISYFERVYLRKHRKIEEDYVINITSDVPVNEERVKENICEEFTQRIDDISHELRLLMIKAIVMLIFGAATLSLWLYVSAKTDSVFAEILSIIGWVFVWEATDIFVLQQADSRDDIRCLKRLIQSDIRFTVAKDAESD